MAETAAQKIEAFEKAIDAKEGWGLQLPKNFENIFKKQEVTEDGKKIDKGRERRDILVEAVKVKFEWLNSQTKEQIKTACITEIKSWSAAPNQWEAGKVAVLYLYNALDVNTTLYKGKENEIFQKVKGEITQNNWEQKIATIDISKIDDTLVSKEIKGKINWLTKSQENITTLEEKLSRRDSAIKLLTEEKPKDVWAEDRERTMTDRQKTIWNIRKEITPEYAGTPVDANKDFTPINKLKDLKKQFNTELETINEALKTQKDSISKNIETTNTSINSKDKTSKLEGNSAETKNSLKDEITQLNKKLGDLNTNLKTIDWIITQIPKKYPDIKTDKETTADNQKNQKINDDVNKLTNDKAWEEYGKENPDLKNNKSYTKQWEKLKQEKETQKNTETARNEFTNWIWSDLLGEMKDFKILNEENHKTLENGLKWLKRQESTFLTHKTEYLNTKQELKNKDQAIKTFNENEADKTHRIDKYEAATETISQTPEYTALKTKVERLAKQLDKDLADINEVVTWTEKKPGLISNITKIKDEYKKDIDTEKLAQSLLTVDNTKDAWDNISYTKNNKENINKDTALLDSMISDVQRYKWVISYTAYEKNINEITAPTQITKDQKNEKQENTTAKKELKIEDIWTNIVENQTEVANSFLKRWKEIVTLANKIPENQNILKALQTPTKENIQALQTFLGVTNPDWKITRDNIQALWKYVVEKTLSA